MLIGLAGCSLKVGDGGGCTLRLQSVLSKSNSLVFKFDFEFELDREFDLNFGDQIRSDFDVYDVTSGKITYSRS